MRLPVWDSFAFECSTSCVVAVGNNPYPVSSVRRVDGNSWNNKRLDFVTFGFQVKMHLFENHALVPSNEAANVFTDDPPRMKLSYDS